MVLPSLGGDASLGAGRSRSVVTQGPLSMKCMLADVGVTIAEIAEMATLGIDDVERIVGETGPGRLQVSL